METLFALFPAVDDSEPDCDPRQGQHTWTWDSGSSGRLTPPIWLRCNCGLRTWADRLASGTPLSADKVEVTS